jgi:hypothetical protein
VLIESVSYHCRLQATPTDVHWPTLGACRRSASARAEECVCSGDRMTVSAVRGHSSRPRDVDKLQPLIAFGSRSKALRRGVERACLDVCCSSWMLLEHCRLSERPTPTSKIPTPGGRAMFPVRDRHHPLSVQILSPHGLSASASCVRLFPTAFLCPRLITHPTTRSKIFPVDAASCIFS